MTTTVTPQGTSQAECALSAFGRKAPANGAISDPDITAAVALLERELDAVNISWCFVCGSAFEPGEVRYIVADFYGNRACVCREIDCRNEVYAALAREGVTAVLS